MAELITQRANELASLSVFADCFGADLYGLAMKLEPLGAFAGDTLMRQGDRADFFLILADGIVGICHEADDGSVVEVAIAGGQVVGEIALLRNSRRIATVVARSEVAAWRGDDDAFDELIELPGVLRMLIRTARQRTGRVRHADPCPVRDGTDLLLRPVLPGDNERTAHGRVEFSSETFYRRFHDRRGRRRKR